MDGESCIQKAYEYILLSDFEQAIYWFEQAIAADPHNAAYYHKCAVSCGRSGKWTKAKEYAEIAETLDSQNEEYRYHLQVIKARLLLAEANALLAVSPPMLDEAAELLHEAARMDPLSFDAYYTLGVVYAAKGQLDQAIANSREALKLEPEHAAAKRLFADVKRRRRMLHKQKSFKKR